jgi:hypothetical protein
MKKEAVKAQEGPMSKYNQIAEDLAIRHKLMRTRTITLILY